MRKAFLAEFGTTLRGLMHHHDVSPADYLEFVHDVPIPEIVPRGRSCGRCSRGSPAGASCSPTDRKRTPAGCSTPWAWPK